MCILGLQAINTAEAILLLELHGVAWIERWIDDGPGRKIPPLVDLKSGSEHCGTAVLDG